MAVKRRERMLRRGVDLEKINSVKKTFKRFNKLLFPFTESLMIVDAICFFIAWLSCFICCTLISYRFMS